MPNEISRVEAGLQGTNNHASRPKWWEGWWSSPDAVMIIQKVSFVSACMRLNENHWI